MKGSLKGFKKLFLRRFVTVGLLGSIRFIGFRALGGIL